MPKELNFEKILLLITERVHSKIPTKIKNAIKSRAVRKTMLQKYGEKAFLDSENLKFPVINPSDGEYHCALIYAAYIRSNIQSLKGGSKQHPTSYYNKIRDKARLLFKQQDCESKLGIHLSENDKFEIGILEFTEMFEINKNEININILENFE